MISNIISLCLSISEMTRTISTSWSVCRCYCWCKWCRFSWWCSVGGVVKLLSKGLWMAGSLSGWFIKSVVYKPLISHSSESSSFNRESQFIVNRSRPKCGPLRRSFYSPTSSSVQSVPELHLSVRWSREQFSSLGISPDNWVLEDQMTV